MAMLSVVTECSNKAAFSGWRKHPKFSAMNAHPFTGEFGRDYYPKVFGEATVDKSFAIVDGETPLALVPCSLGPSRLDYYGMPIRLFVRSNLDRNLAERAIERAFDQFDEVLTQDGGRIAVVADHASAGTLSVIGKECLNRGSAAATKLSGTCDLRQGEAEMRLGLRKSYRSLVNWGRRNLDMRYVGKDNPDPSLFRCYQDFHKVIAGRSTRSQQSWDAMFEFIAGGRGELVLGYLESGELVAGTMVVDGTEVASYASGVYDRNRFDKPMAHWPLWLAILRSAERGMRWFDLGDVPLTGADQKEIDIGYFKRGFTSQLSAWISWSWPVTGPAKQAAIQ